ncbi:hypothetical protein O181_007321 [Austropuccinia psidii MF-1]|uniref:DUF726-domain-containing protein n=1 Tax=Austropuccinia psidii MF-1 TaxID=1389203 RepID=A0A9Q3GHI1_9BASI|nr:hypothetical protein [Austropuccinia psidii MF-1]
MASEAPEWSPTVGLIFDDDDDDWQEMPVIRSENSVYDEEDQKKFRYFPPQARLNVGSSSQLTSTPSNATGKLLDLSEAAASRGEDWREKSKQLDESNYTRLGLDDDPDEDNLNMQTQYLFDDKKGMTPLSQLKATKNFLSESQRIAYVSMCCLVMKDMLEALKRGGHHEMDPAVESMKHWSTIILDRLFRHMDVEPREQQMIEQLAEHGLSAEDLVDCLITTHTVSNPNYDPDAASMNSDQSDKCLEKKLSSNTDPIASFNSRSSLENDWDTKSLDNNLFTSTHHIFGDSFRSSSTSFGFSDPSMSAPWTNNSSDLELTHPNPSSFNLAPSACDPHEAILDSEAITPQPTNSSFADPIRAKSSDNPPKPSDDLPHTLPGVSTTVTAADQTITLDIRWTVLCDLFLAVIADSVYDARSRVLLGRCAHKLRLSWLDVVRFERRLTEALEMQEGISKENPAEVIDEHERKAQTKRMIMVGAATIGGGLVIGLSAGLLAPVIGAGLAAGFTTIGITGTSGFLAGTGGAAVITTAGTFTGMNIAGKGMGKRTQAVKTFEILPLHNNGRVNVFLTMSGFMEGANDDVRLPFSVMDQSMGDVLSVLWEPEMMGETGNIIKILTSEVLTQVGQQVLQATILTALMSALQWPLMLTKLGYLIDNPWSNALDRARAAGALLADILIKRHIGVRPVSLIGFSLGARAIFYALVELARKKTYGIVQEVYLIGATVTAPTRTWREIRGVVAGRFVNAYCKKDWILGYLYRATTGGLQTVAGLSPVESVPDLENVDLTEIVVGHMSYRAQMPSILAVLGFKVTADHFDEPEAMEEDDEPQESSTQLKTVKEAEEKKRMILNFTNKLKVNRRQSLNLSKSASASEATKDESDDPPRLEHPLGRSASCSSRPPMVGLPQDGAPAPLSADAMKTHSREQLKPETFDVSAIRKEIAKVANETDMMVARESHDTRLISASASWTKQANSSSSWQYTSDPWKT